MLNIRYFVLRTLYSVLRTLYSVLGTLYQVLIRFPLLIPSYLCRAILVLKNFVSAVPSGSLVRTSE